MTFNIFTVVTVNKRSGLFVCMFYMLVVFLNGCGGGSAAPEKGDVLGDPTENTLTPEKPDSMIDQISSGPLGTGKLNDTGVWGCVAYNSTTRKFSRKLVPCGKSFDDNGAEVAAGQDGHFGRDISQATNDSRDGRLGFSFAKIGKSGEFLSSDAQKWQCVLDNVTGLMWEVKNHLKRSPHYYKDKYTWYFSDSNRNGGVPGKEMYRGCFGFEDGIESSYCNTEAFIKRVNESGLCGRSNWRLPTVDELVGLRDYGSLGEYGIDIEFFPGALIRGYYWTSQTDAGRVRNAWAVEIGDGLFAGGLDTSFPKSFSHYVRLVSE